MEATVTVPYAVLIPLAILAALLTLTLAALTVNRTSVRQRQDLSPPSRHTNRSQCPRPACTTVHPGSGKHRVDPRPDSAIDVFISALACGFGMINVPKGHHRQATRDSRRASKNLVISGSYDMAAGRTRQPAYR